VSKKQSAKSKAGQQARQRQAIQPYRDGEAVLLVGEGNFSFARAYAKRFPRSAKVSVATSYDSEKEAKEKYSDLEAILADVSSVLGLRVAAAQARLTLALTSLRNLE
jgi:25S rRNA (uracil2634-N3)-methyltransferase